MHVVLWQYKAEIRGNEGTMDGSKHTYYHDSFKKKKKKYYSRPARKRISSYLSKTLQIRGYYN